MQILPSSISGTEKLTSEHLPLPVFYSFRRCPYAIRARLTLAMSGVKVELREVLLRDKAPEFLATSPSATVPCLQTPTGIIDESLDIMLWSLSQNDPDDWLDCQEESLALVAQADGPFKLALDRTKYANRYPGEDPEDHRANANAFLELLDARLAGNGWLIDHRPRLADFAILPFVRQFAFIDKARFDKEAGQNLCQWLETFLASSLFGSVMHKYPVWVAGDPVTSFP